MRFFVDANVILYGARPSPYRDPCLKLLGAIAEGAVDGTTSTAALEEVWHIELSGRVGDLGGLTRRSFDLLTPLLAVGDEAFQLALSLDAPALGANDRLHAATCIANDIGVIVSADSGFDGVRGLSRVDPLDGAAMDRLIVA